MSLRFTWCVAWLVISLAAQAADTGPFGGAAPKPAAKAKPAADSDPFAEPPAPAPKAKPAPAADPFAPDSGAAPKVVAGPEMKANPAPKQLPPKEAAQPSSPRARPAEPVLSGVEPGVEKIEQALASPTSLEFTEAPLTDVLAYLEDFHKIPILPDKRALKDAGVDPSAAVSMNLKGVSLRSALDLLLRQHGLTWTVRSQTLLITTPEEAESLLAIKLYDVADLVQVRDEKDALWDDYDLLTQTVTTAVAPASWSATGGPGSIIGGTFGGGRVLIVSQTWRNHEQVKALLEELRKFAKAGKDQKPPMRPRPPIGMGGGMMGMGGFGGMGGMMPGMAPGGMVPGTPPAAPSLPAEPAKPEAKSP